MLFGSHDSAANKFDFSIQLQRSGKWEMLRRLSKTFRCIRDRVIALSRTQSLTIFEQLEQGARILDIRVSYANGVFYTSHTFCCGLLSDALKQITNFIDRTPELERLVIMVSPDFQNQSYIVGHEVELVDMLCKLVSDRVNVLYKPIQINLDKYPVEDLYRVTSTYYDVDNVADFRKKFVETEFRDESVIHCVLTPQPQFKKLMKASIEEYAAEINPVALVLLEHKELPDGATFDFFPPTSRNDIRSRV